MPSKQPVRKRFSIKVLSKATISIIFREYNNVKSACEILIVCALSRSIISNFNCNLGLQKLTVATRALICKLRCFWFLVWKRTKNKLGPNSFQKVLLIQIP